MKKVVVYTYRYCSSVRYMIHVTVPGTVLVIIARTVLHKCALQSGAREGRCNLTDMTIFKVLPREAAAWISYLNRIHLYAPP